MRMESDRKCVLFYMNECMTISMSKLQTVTVKVALPVVQMEWNVLNESVVFQPQRNCQVDMKRHEFTLRPFFEISTVDPFDHPTQARG